MAMAMVVVVVVVVVDCSLIKKREKKILAWSLSDEQNCGEKI